MSRDNVEHPAHYNWIPGIECIDVAQHFTFNLANAMKYIWRAPVELREKSIEDLHKAIFYLEFEIKRLEQGG